MQVGSNLCIMTIVGRKVIHLLRHHAIVDLASLTMCSEVPGELSAIHFRFSFFSSTSLTFEAFPCTVDRTTISEGNWDFSNIKLVA